jgi:hypothetical protein
MSINSHKPPLTRHEVLLSKFQNFSEADFTHFVLEPLFKALGYHVDYHGGPAEGGKDLICRKGGDFGFQEVAVVQVKKMTPSAAVGKSNSFAGVVAQLEQALEKMVPSLSGTLQCPNNVYFITPFEIDTRTLETRFEGLKRLLSQGVRVLDGRAVADELIKCIPELVEQLCGHTFAIQNKLLSNISNVDLLSALNYSSEKRIADFYCDLDFGVGKITTKSLFLMDFSSTEASYAIPSNRWVGFEKLALKIERLSGVEFLKPSLLKVRLTYAEEMERWQSPENQVKIRKIHALATELEALVNAFIENSARIIADTLTEEIVLDKSRKQLSAKNANKLTVEQSDRLNKIRESNISLSSKLEAWRGYRQVTPLVFAKISENIDASEKHLQEIRVETAILTATGKSSLSSLLRDVAGLNRLVERLGKLMSDRVAEPEYAVLVNGRALQTWVEKERSWLSDNVADLSARKHDPNEVRDFFLRCQELFETLSETLDDRYFKEAIGATAKKDSIFLAPTQRISMPLREVFATGIHCAVFGEAGAGKSTTLHQYASFASKNDRINELTLFLPLTRILGERLVPLNENGLSSLQKLEYSLATYLGVGKPFSVDEIIIFIKEKKRVTFIFDGVDEVVKRAPWIIEAIEQIAAAYPNGQIILSSRMSGSYVDQIRYLGLTLLPFTDEQVSHFISGWFIDNQEKASAVKSHLDATIELREIVRSPLLATILCVLAEHEVPLPNGELNMYSERLKLLFGHYDIHKKTKRIDSHYTLLDKVARKLAFYMHGESLRSMSPADLESIAVRIFESQGDVGEVQVRKAVQELIDPCNVLVPMTADGDFGFGHLRYQEYLSATELCSNRGIDLAAILTSPWWRSVLVLFAKLTDNITYVIQDVLEKGLNVTKSRDNLIAMLNTRDKAGRVHLEKLIDDHVRLDKFESNVIDFEDNEWDEKYY